MKQHEPGQEELSEAVFRNGSITVVGVLLAFSLGFLTHWAANPIPWQKIDLFAVVSILIGIVLQTKALADLCTSIRSSAGFTSARTAISSPA